MQIPHHVNSPKYPDLIIRPSAVWDTRRPLAAFLLEYRERLRRLNILSLARCRLLAELREHEADGKIVQARDFFWLNKIKRSHPKLSQEVGFSWSSYGYQLKGKVPNKPFDPLLSDIKRDLSQALTDVRLSAVIQIVSAFEAFAQAWSLNYLLAKLEAGVNWTPEERELAMSFSPISVRPQQKKGQSKNNHTSSRTNKMSQRVPDWHAILRAFPELDQLLRNEPHFEIDLKSSVVVGQVVTDTRNAKATLQFWRDFRNLVVHRSRIVTKSFARKYQELYRNIADEQEWIVPELSAGSKIFLHFEIPRVMGFTHRGACEAMDDLLFHLSEGARGSGKRQVHWYAGLDPELTPDDVLLKDGDHDISLKWSNDGDFRRSFLRRNSLTN